MRFGVVNAPNGNIRMLINRDRSYQNLRYLLLKGQADGRDHVEFIAISRTKKTP